VRGSLSDYRADILSCISEGSQAFARMKFGGIHVAPFRGFPPSGRRVEWEAAAVFTFRDDRIAALWVLGDLVALDEQLRRNAEK
jgi:predicted ester cyclase